MNLGVAVIVDVKPIEAIRDRMRKDAGLQTFLRDVIDLRPGQEEYFFKLGVDGKKRVGLPERRFRIDYYGNPPAPPATSVYPYMWWTGRSMRHTTHEDADISVKPGELRVTNRLETIDADKDRPFANQWWRVDTQLKYLPDQLAAHIDGHWFSGDRIKRRAS